MPELSTLEVLLRLTVAAVLGGAIGMEREIREREAGLRTHLLVSVGAALFTLVSAYAWSDWSFSTPRGIVFDPTRIAAQIVTGIGFLGAGAIIRQGLSVRGLTTAATLWLVAAIGMASGAGYWEAAVIATVGALVTLWPLRLVAHRVLTRIRPEDEQRLVVDLAGQQGAAPVLASLEGLGGRVSQFQLSESRDGRELVLTVEFPERMDASSVAGRLAELEDVRGVRWADSERVRARLASKNENKLRELRAALPDWELELLDTDGYPPETGSTYYENARAKALHGRALASPDVWVLGEDSGIEAAALGGRPGVESARWAEDGVAALLHALEGEEDRRARYVCELVAIDGEGSELRGRGTSRAPPLSSRAAARASATTRSSSRSARPSPWRSSATRGRCPTHIERRPRRR